MPLNCIPAKDFLGRNLELDHLKRLSHLKQDALSGNILLEGSQGIGKTELLKQLYRAIFWESRDIIPFYYSFRSAALKSSYFAKDYFTRFVRQYLAFLAKEPFLTENMSTPLTRLIPRFASHGADWIIESIEDLEEYAANGDLYGQILAAISVPVTAALKGGKPVLIMLDDFTLAERIYESRQGDAPGLTTLFEESMKNDLCPHIITGSPAGMLETIFSDHALLSHTERMSLHPLPEDISFDLLRSNLEKAKISCNMDNCLTFLRLLRGNPLYIRNLARAAWKMRKDDLAETDLRESYSFEVSQGETAFYWSSCLHSFMRDPSGMKGVLKILMHRISRGETGSCSRLSGVLGMRESETGAALDILRTSGILENRDPVFRDFIECTYMREVEGKSPEQVRQAIEMKYASGEQASCFELCIPMGGNAELVAARAVEQIGRNLNLNPDLLNAIQLALIEACINAAEHSGSYDNKVHIRIMPSAERLEIQIESPGRQFAPGQAPEVPADEKIRSERKRGWGFPLIRKIMDDVRVERIHDRTRVVLIKKIQGNEVLK